MPVFRNKVAIEIAKGLKVFLSLEAGAVRGPIPWDGDRGDKKLLEQKDRQLAQQRKRIENLEGWLSKKDQSLGNLRRRLADKPQTVTRQNGSGWRPPIFFVVGCSRSGTNWMMRTLNAHPEVLCRGEGRFFGRKLRVENLKEMQAGEYIRYETQPASLYNALSESEYLQLWIERSVWTRDSDAEQHIMELTREAVYHFLTKKLSESGKSMVGDKTPLSRPEIVKEISTICPEAKVIHIVRDGRDTSISGLHHKWNRATDEGGVHELTLEERDKRDRYREDPQGFLEFGESIFSERLLREAARGWKFNVADAYRAGPALLEDNYAEVHYEELLQSPEKEFGRLFEFLGARSDEETVARCVQATSFEKRSGGRERGQEDTRSGVRKGIAGDWKNVFTERDREIFKEEAGDLLIELGYEKDKNW